MIDLEKLIEDTIAEATKPIRPEPIPISATRFAVLPSAGQFEALANGGEFQAAAGLFCRMVAAAGADCDVTLDRIGQIMLADQQRELSQMWRFTEESLATTPDKDEAVELGLMREVMAACVADHASRSDRRRQFFQSVTGEMGTATISRGAIDWLLCK